MKGALTLDSKVPLEGLHTEELVAHINPDIGTAVEGTVGNCDPGFCQIVLACKRHLKVVGE